jgi:hypothetical protein
MMTMRDEADLQVAGEEKRGEGGEGSILLDFENEEEKGREEVEVGGGSGHMGFVGENKTEDYMDYDHEPEVISPVRTKRERERERHTHTHTDTHRDRETERGRNLKCILPPNQQEWRKELDELEPKRFSERPPHLLQEGWIDNYYEKASCFTISTGTKATNTDAARLKNTKSGLKPPMGEH